MQTKCFPKHPLAWYTSNEYTSWWFVDCHHVRWHHIRDLKSAAWLNWSQSQLCPRHPICGSPTSCWVQGFSLTTECIFHSFTSLHPHLRCNITEVLQKSKRRERQNKQTNWRLSFLFLASVCSSCLYRWVCASAEECGRLPSDWFLSCSLSALGGCSLEINDVGSTKANKPLLSSAAVLSVFFPSPPLTLPSPSTKLLYVPQSFGFCFFPSLSPLFLATRSSFP